MSFTEHSLALQSVDLGKAVLALSVLGIFSKLLHIDIGSLQILGLSLSKTTAALIPGFLGLLLIYTFVAYCVSRMESGFYQATNTEAKNAQKDIREDKGLLFLIIISSPFAFFVYSMPYILGALSIYLLWSDSMNVLKAVWVLI